MKKRFTDTEIWDDPWFQSLDPVYKCLWKYLCDKCDNSGVWKVNKPLAEFQIKSAINWDSLHDLFGDRFMMITESKLFVVAFIEFQYGELKESSRPHQQVLRLLQSHGLRYPIDTLSIPLAKGIDTLSIPYPKGIHTLLDKDKDKDKDKEEDKDKDKDTVECQIIKSPLEMAFDKFREMRKKIRKPMTERAEELIWKELSKLAGEDSDLKIEILEQSIRNGWQDVYAVKNKSQRQFGKQQYSRQDAIDTFDFLRGDK